jgi:hypothetical protein
MQPHDKLCTWSGLAGQNQLAPGIVACLDHDLLAGGLRIPNLYQLWDACDPGCVDTIATYGEFLMVASYKELAKQLLMFQSERDRLSALVETNESKIQSICEAIATKELFEMERHGPNWSFILTQLDTKQEPASLVEARENFLAFYGLSSVIIHGRVTLRLRRLNNRGCLSSFGLYQEAADKIAAGIRIVAPHLQAGPDGQCLVDFGDGADGRELFLDITAGVGHVQLKAYIHDLAEDYELLAEGNLCDVIQAALSLLEGTQV